MAQREIVVLGASMGGIPVLKTLLGRLPTEFPASLIIVQHLSPTHPSRLAEILNKVGPLSAEPAQDGQPICPGRVYVAPQDHHLMLESGRLRLTRGPRENRQGKALQQLLAAENGLFPPGGTNSEKVKMRAKSRSTGQEPITP